MFPQSVSRGWNIRGFNGSPICYGLPGCSTPCTDLAGLPANGAFYFQAFGGSVALPEVFHLLDLRPCWPLPDLNLLSSRQLAWRTLVGVLAVRWLPSANALNRCRDNRCAGGVVLEVDVAITTSGSSQAFRSVDHHVADKNRAQALSERASSGDGLGVCAFHYSTDPRPSSLTGSAPDIVSKHHVPAHTLCAIDEHASWDPSF
jgi:hypothetical protein